LLGLGAVVALDLVGSAISTGTVGRGMLDEPAHLLTAALILSAMPRSSVRQWWWWALAGSVVIDIDHLPLYTFAPQFSVAGGRPPTHSIATVAALLVLGAMIPRLRAPLVGLAAGVCLHLFRDVATGPGAPLLWPLSDIAVQLPYPVYLALVTAAAAIASGRSWRRAGRP
jgi:inner membrane protein